MTDSRPSLSVVSRFIEKYNRVSDANNLSHTALVLELMIALEPELQALLERVDRLERDLGSVRQKGTRTQQAVEKLEAQPHNQWKPNSEPQPSVPAEPSPSIHERTAKSLTDQLAALPSVTELKELVQAVESLIDETKAQIPEDSDDEIWPLIRRIEAALSPKRFGQFREGTSYRQMQHYMREILRELETVPSAPDTEPLYEVVFTPSGTFAAWPKGAGPSGQEWPVVYTIPESKVLVELERLNSVRETAPQESEPAPSLTMAGIQYMQEKAEAQLPAIPKAYDDAVQEIADRFLAQHKTAPLESEPVPVASPLQRKVQEAFDDGRTHTFFIDGVEGLAELLPVFRDLNVETQLSFLDGKTKITVKSAYATQSLRDEIAEMQSPDHQAKVKEAVLRMQKKDAAVERLVRAAEHMLYLSGVDARMPPRVIRELREALAELDAIKSDGSEVE